MFRQLAIATLLILPATGFSQEAPVFTTDDAARMTECIAALEQGAGDDGEGEFRPRTDCIGAAFAACSQLPEGETTVGMRECFARETDWWDSQLNSDYAMLHDSLAPDLADRLQAVQREWIEWRDTLCGFERELGGDGTIALLVGDDCYLSETARRATAIANYLASGQGL